MSHENRFNFAYRNGFAVEETEQWDRPALAHNPTAAIRRRQACTSTN